jgi:hypothetical protein
MKNKFRLIFVMRNVALIALAAGMLFSLAACGEDEDDIVGNWYLSLNKAEFVALINEEEPGAGELAAGMIELLGFKFPIDVAKTVFATNGSCQAFAINPINGSENLFESGTYTTSGNTVTVITENRTSTATINGDTMTTTENGMAVVLKKR